MPPRLTGNGGFIETALPGLADVPRQLALLDSSCGLPAEPFAAPSNSLVVTWKNALYGRDALPARHAVRLRRRLPGLRGLSRERHMNGPPREAEVSLQVKSMSHWIEVCVSLGEKSARRSCPLVSLGQGYAFRKCGTILRPPPATRTLNRSNDVFAIISA